MIRDYRLYELSDDEFEKLVVQICTRWLGQGVTPFAQGKDAGRDGKFHGTANSFPSAADPFQGHFVLQAKHVNSPNKSCSDREFQSLVKKEHSKVKALIEAGICDHYLIFTNRKLTGGADQKLIAELQKLGLKSAHIIGDERIGIALEEFQDIRETLPNFEDAVPFRFEPDDVIEVIAAFHDYTSELTTSEFNSARDFKDTPKIRDQKNKINGLSDAYYQEIIIDDSMVHFSRIKSFLNNPRNKEYATLYHDAADELKQKILVNRSKFKSFDAVFSFLSEQIQHSRIELRGKRRLVNILLHYMYFDCDIGSKHAPIAQGSGDANA